MSETIDVTECPDCGEVGRYDSRVKIRGRGVYTCPDGHRWQDLEEVPSTKGYVEVGPIDPPKPANYHPYA